jgi:hypothetical protein
MPVPVFIHLPVRHLVLLLLFAHSALAQPNGVTREVWYNISGGAVSDLTNSANFPNNPDELSVESSFEAPSQFADSYGQRMRAILVPPVTGNYVFWIASDDGGALFLSSSEDPAKSVRIAYENSWAGVREYHKTATAKSAPITLTNGMRYYIEALQKEGGGGDNLAVTWQKPGDPVPANGADPIPGAYLIPVGLTPPVITRQPASAEVVEGGGVSFSIELAQRYGATYQWFRNDNPIIGGTNSLLLLPVVKLEDTASRFRCFVQNAYGSTNSTTAVLTVLADTTPPIVQSAGGLGEPNVLTVVFSEPVEAASATNHHNYSIDGGVVVFSVKWGMDNRTVILHTSSMSKERNYVLTVENVRDLAASPNTITSGSTVNFSLVAIPLEFALTRPALEPAGPSSRRGPIIISEVMYNPTNTVDGKNLEFIEIYNSNPFPEEISGYQMAGEVEFTFPTNSMLPARSYVVIAGAPDDLQAVYGPIGNLVGAYSNKLANGSGTLQLRNRQGGIVFDLQYKSSDPWPASADGAGHSLVLARPSMGERNPAAWAQSDFIGGSPGRGEAVTANPHLGLVINEVLAHTDLPQLDYVEVFNAGTTGLNLEGCILTDSIGADKYVFPPGTVLDSHAYLCLDETQLGFRLSSAGETVYLLDPWRNRVLDCLKFGPQENGVPFGRYPDGSRSFHRLEVPTPGSGNTRYRLPPVVINEIMYDPITGQAEDEFLELHNHTALPVDLSRWRLRSAVEFTIPGGTVIQARGFLVIAKSPGRLLATHSNLTAANVLGGYSGRLARRGDRAVLSMPDAVLTTNTLGQVITNWMYIDVDEVTYGSGGRWGDFSKGGGSSLELLDPRSDRRLAPNWADSDESHKSEWVTIEHTGVLDHGNTGFSSDSLQVLLLGPGECLVDNVEVFVGSGQNLVANSQFSTGLEGWVPQGNHERSGWAATGGFNGTGSLHIRATDRGDTGANRVRTTLTAPLAAGQTATIRAKVRWLAGCPEILFRIRGNWLEATGNTLRAQNLGTPGAPNSRAVLNAGPAISEVRHWPILPANQQNVIVFARVDDPDGLAGLILNYRMDPSTNILKVTMSNRGGGIYTATIPGQAAGKLAAFHIQAMDNALPAGHTLFPSDAPKRECLVRWGDPAVGPAFGTYRVWMTQSVLERWSKREKLSNEPVDCTFVYGSSRVIYNIGGQYSGSPWHSPGYNSPIGNVCDYVFNFPEDDRLLGEKDATLQWPGNGGGDNTYQREQTAYWIAEQMGLPYCHRRSVNLFINGVRRAEMFDDAQQPNGDLTDEFYPEGKDGELHKIQVWYEFDDAASNFSGRGANFGNYTTTGGIKKMAVYRWTFAKRAVQDSMNNYTNLYALVDAVNYTGLGPAYRRQLESKVDVSNWLRTYAVQHAVGNNDSFAYGGGQNMYTYRPVGDTWKMLIWDIDFAFVSQPPDSDMFSGIGRSNGIDLSEPGYRRLYWEILQDLAYGPLVGTKVNPVVDAKYSAMIANGRNIESPAGIKNYIAQRRNYLLNQIGQNVPNTFGLTLNNGDGFSTNRNYLQLTGRAGLMVRSITVNGVPHPNTWTSVSDWSLLVALKPGENTLQVVGLNAQGLPVSGASASITITNTAIADTPEEKLMISEIMYNPLQPKAAYVELYNASATTAFDLSGWRLKGADFTFPGGSVLGTREFGVVAADRLSFALAYNPGIPVFGEFQGNLRNEGEMLQLLKPGAASDSELTVDEVRYEARAPWPLSPNGLGPSLQLIDPEQENNRVGNWGAMEVDPESSLPRWRYVAVSGTATSSTLYMYLTSPGEAYLDDIKLVAGNVPELGPNLLANGDFESIFPGPWGLAPIFSTSVADASVQHSGSRSLHMVSTGAGSSRNTSIYQDILPYLTLGNPYTLSFWYLENPKGGRLVVRLSGNGVGASVDLAENSSGPGSIYTPGSPNALSRTLPPLPPLWLNEIAPTNYAGATDRFGRTSPWVELFNASGTNMNLNGFFLSTNTANLLQWQFPAAITIGPGGFLLVWLDGRAGDSTSAEPHTSFQVASRSGSLFLASTNGGSTNVVDYLNFSLARANSTYGAFPDGSATRRQEFFIPTPGASNNPASPPLNVLINEWMADNQSTIADPADNDLDDWFELYNPGSTPADLTGFYLGTTLLNRTKFQIPAGYVVPAKGYLLVWADSESNQNSTNRPDLHVNFKLARSGEAIGLFAPDGTIIDYVSFGEQLPDVSEGRFPDGGEAVAELTLPTPGAPNFLLQSNSPPIIAQLLPRVVFEGQLLALQIEATDPDPMQLLHFDLLPGVSTDAVLNSLTGWFSWRPAAEHVSRTYVFSFEVSDNGEPPLSSLASLEVTVVPLPKVTAVRTDSGSCSLSFVTIPGKTYRLDYTESLLTPDWRPLSEQYLAQADELTITDDTFSAGQRFYRITVLE